MARSSNPSNSESPSSSRSPSGEEREETEFLADESPVEEEDDVPENGPPEEEILDECLHKYQEVFEDTFEEMRLTTDVVEEVRQAFNQFIALQSSRDAAGEAIYSSVFEAAPSMQNLFKTPRSVMALRFMNGIVTILTLAHDPAGLKAEVQSVGFRHLDREVTPSRAAVFRDAIADLLDMELPNGLSSRARLGFQAIMNYVAGGYIYIRKNYSTRVKVIQRSWRIANNKATSEDDTEEGAEAADKVADDPSDALKKSKSFDNSNGSREEVGRSQSKRESTMRTTASELKVPLLNALDCWMSYCIMILVAASALYLEPINKVGVVADFVDNFNTGVMVVIFSSISAMIVMALCALFHRAAMGGNSEYAIFNLGRSPNPDVLAAKMKEMAELLAQMETKEIEKAFDALAVFDTRRIMNFMTMMSAEVLDGRGDLSYGVRVSSASFSAKSKAKPKPSIAEKVEAPENSTAQARRLC